MKIKPCKKCGSSDIKIYDCGYSSFNCYGGECENCGRKSGTTVGGCSPSIGAKISAWNDRQRLDDSDKLKLEKQKTRKLRKQLRDHDLSPII